MCILCRRILSWTKVFLTTKWRKSSCFPGLPFQNSICTFFVDWVSTLVTTATTTTVSTTWSGATNMPSRRRFARCAEVRKLKNAFLWVEGVREVSKTTPFNQNNTVQNPCIFSIISEQLATNLCWEHPRGDYFANKDAWKYAHVFFV